MEQVPFVERESAKPIAGHLDMNRRAFRREENEADDGTRKPNIIHGRKHLRHGEPK